LTQNHKKSRKLRGPKQEKKRNWPRAGRRAIHLPPVGISGHWKMKFTSADFNSKMEKYIFILSYYAKTFSYFVFLEIIDIWLGNA